MVPIAPWVYIWISMGFTVHLDPDTIFTSVSLVLNGHAVVVGDAILHAALLQHLLVVQGLVVHQISDRWERRRDGLPKNALW